MLGSNLVRLFPFWGPLSDGMCWFFSDADLRIENSGGVHHDCEPRSDDAVGRDWKDSRRGLGSCQESNVIHASKLWEADALLCAPSSGSPHSLYD